MDSEWWNHANFSSGSGWQNRRRAGAFNTCIHDNRSKLKAWQYSSWFNCKHTFWLSIHQHLLTLLTHVILKFIAFSSKPHSEIYSKTQIYFQCKMHSFWLPRNNTLTFFLPGAVLHCLCKRWLSRLLITEQQPSSSSSVHQHKLCCVQPTQHLSCEALNRLLMCHVNNKNNWCL